MDWYWSSQINNFFDYDDFEAARTSHSRGSRRDRTGTRAFQGHIHTRWSEGLESARGVASLKQPWLPKHVVPVPRLRTDGEEIVVNSYCNSLLRCDFISDKGKRYFSAGQSPERKKVVVVVAFLR